ncbi:MAG: hypothetical protein KKD39_00960 [Candidatus Altiarchaeota archaeon]|nr:hypothetical protein [Candidatus Altiarchaeota archaeon]
MDRKHHPMLITTLLVFFSLIIIELQHPNFFLNDDNLTACLPIFFYNYDSVVHGEIPFFNFHQYLGVEHPPLLSRSLYPPTYVSVFLSYTLFGNYLSAIDIYVMLHIIAGGVGIFLLLSKLKLDKTACIFGSITWSLNSFVVYGSDSWIVISPTVAYLPLLLLFDYILFEKFSPKTFLLSVFLRILYFLEGYAQYFIYTLIFEILFINLLLVLTNPCRKSLKLFFQKNKTLFVGCLISLLFILPLVISSVNSVNKSYSRSKNLFVLDFLERPYHPGQFFSDLTFSNVINYSDYEKDTQSFIGYVGIMTIPLIFYLFYKLQVSGRKRIVYVFTALLITAYALSAFTPLQIILYFIPLLNRFRWFFKIHLYTIFFIVILSSYGFDILQGKLKQKKRQLAAFILFLHLLTLLGVYIISPVYNFAPPFQNNAISPFVDDPIQSVLREGRIITVSNSSGWEGVVRDPVLYGYSYATLHGLIHFYGYDVSLPKTNFEKTLHYFPYSPVLPDKTQIPTLRRWGVRWYLMPKNTPHEYLRVLAESDLTLFYVDGKRIIYEDKSAKPLVFLRKQGEADELTYDIASNGIHVEAFNSKEQPLYFNWLFNDNFIAFIDGAETVVGSDGGMTYVVVPEGKHNIKLIYHDRALINSLTLQLFIVLVFSAVFWKNRKIIWKLMS